MASRDLSIHVLFALIVFFLAVYAEYSGLDLWIAHQFYDPANNQWPFRSLFATETLLHDFAQTLVKLIGLVTIVMVIISRVFESLTPYRTPLTYLLLASATGPLIVTFLKNITHIQIPWHLAEFGGDMPYIRLFDSVDQTLPIGHAFPGGHSSAGFAFFSVYFLFHYYAPSYRYYGLAIPLALGLLFGGDQEIRGAHFVSHDLMSLFICWSSALFWAHLYLRKQSLITDKGYTTT